MYLYNKIAKTETKNTILLNKLLLFIFYDKNVDLLSDYICFFLLTRPLLKVNNRKEYVNNSRNE